MDGKVYTRKTFDTNKEKFGFDRSQDITDSKPKQWNSGYINRGRKMQRNDPWWMRDEEKNNPRVLPRRIPWWFAEPSSLEIPHTAKIADLKAIADARNINCEGLKKSEMFQKLKTLNDIYTMTGTLQSIHYIKYVLHNYAII